METGGGWRSHQARQRSRAYPRRFHSMAWLIKLYSVGSHALEGDSSVNGRTEIRLNIPGQKPANGQESTICISTISGTFTTWLTQCGVDYAVIQTLKGDPLPGSAKYYIHNWDGRLRDAVTRLESFTRAILNAETTTQVPPSYLEQSLSMRNVVPRDRIELSTPAFSGLCSTN